MKITRLLKRHSFYVSFYVSFYKCEINSVKYILVKSKKQKCNEDTGS